MTKRRVSAFEARTHFGEILDRVRYRKEPCVVEKNGRPAAVIVDLEAYQALEGLREEEQYIEVYSRQRLEAFMKEDRLSPAEAKRLKRRFKTGS